MDVVFISPTITENILEESVGTLLLSTILREEGIDVNILSFYDFGDTKNFQVFIDNAVKMICDENPKIVSFYTRCDCYHIMLTIAEKIKKEIGCYIVFGGPQADISAKSTIDEIQYVDFVCCGEGETTIYPFFSSLLKDEPDTTVAGLVYRDGNKTVMNPRPELIENLDTLPLVDYSIFSKDAKVDITQPFIIDVGRGCPFGCTYCSTKTFWGRKYRLKSPQRIVDEIKYYNNKFGVIYFAFEHDMFTMNRKAVIEVCRLINELDFKINWKCSARIDCIDKELIDIMIDSGCDRIYIGIETGSQRMQKIINKNLKLSEVLDILSYIHSKNIEIVTSFIFGFPEETEEDISQTIAMIFDILKMSKISMQTHLCTFLPGTELLNQYKDGLTETTNLSDITGEIGFTECIDLIKSHPDLFCHFKEYKTDLRSKLEFFQIFMRVVKYIRLPYLFYSENYSKKNFIQLYYDFVTNNNELLQKNKEMNDDDLFFEIINSDGFSKKFEKCEYAQVISDIYRLKCAEYSVMKNKSEIKKVISRVSPEDLQKCSDIRQCVLKLYMVTYKKDENGKLKVIIQS